MRTIAFTWLIFMVSITSSSADSGKRQWFGSEHEAWKVIDSDHFTVYYTRGSETGAHQCMKYATDNLKGIEDKVGFPLSGKIEIVYFNSLYDLNRSYMNREITFSDINLAGLTTLGNNLFPVYRTTSGKDLTVQIKRGIARILVNDMIFEGTVQEKIKYRTLLHLPPWFIEGLSEYLAAGWDEVADDRLKKAFAMNAFQNMNLVSNENEILAGQSIWKYIDERKGDMTIPRILYLVRLTRKVESSIYFVFNWSMKDLFREWESYYRGIYTQDSKRRMPLGEEMISAGILQSKISNLRISPEGDKIAFVAFNGNRYSLVVHQRFATSSGVHDAEDKIQNTGAKTDRIWYEVGRSGESMIYDPSVLIFDWKDDHSIYLVQRTGSGSQLLEVTESGVKEISVFKGLENVSHLVYDGSSSILLAASGTAGGAIYKYDTRTASFLLVLGDSADYNEPAFDVNALGFYFTRSSPLKKDTFGRHWNSDVGYFRFTDNTITWVADDPRFDEFAPLRYGNRAISFLSDENGIRNAYLFDGENTVGLTDYQHNILAQSNARNVPLVVEMLEFKGEHHLYVSEYVSDIQQLSSLIYAAPTYYASKRYKVSTNRLTDTSSGTEEQEKVTVEITFQTDFPNDDIDSILAVHATKKREKEIISVRDHRLKWVPTHVITQFHNGMLNTDRFPAYRVPQASFTNPMSVHGGLVIQNVHHNKILTGGIKTNTNFYRLELYANYESRKDKFIHNIKIWRNSAITSTGDQFYFKNLSGDGSINLSYPVRDKVILNGGLGFRRDKRIFLSSGSESLQEGSLEQRLARFELSATLNRLRNKALNTYEGLHVQMKTEYQFRIGEQGNFGASRLEIRYAKKLAPLLHWANHLEVNNSYGAGQIRFFIGGMENWIDPGIKLNPYLASERTTYFVPVFGIRGFQYNVRNGNTSATFSSELRYGIGKLLIRRTGQSEFIENMMFTAFYDMGSAWYGKSPYDRINPLNSRTIETGAMLIKVYNPKDPLIFGIGGGMRTSIFTYYFKWDVGFGRDNGEWKPNIHYITIGKDF